VINFAAIRRLDICYEYLRIILKNNELMKKYILVVLMFSLFSGLTFAQSAPAKIKWYTIQEALVLNKKTPKKFLIDVYTEWCGWCKRMDAQTFSDPVIAEFINTNFYPVKFDAESKEPVVFQGQTFINKGIGSRPTHQFAEALLNGQMSYPSVAYLTPELQLIGAIPGYRGPADIEPLLNYIAFDKYKAVKFDEFQSTFKGKVAKQQ
jgi:thioredoxin-related protein